ncbi:MAG TPA: ABC transporter ATP-binding protein [Thermodesulfobacteriota bacterium]|nr:ABC transporter ATP-binding protein [Thermodesulfobacteriota bacterium]
MKDALFLLQDIIHTYQNRIVLNIPSLSFQPRLIHAITGPNGSGKTTLCAILAMLLKPTAGLLTYCGIPVDQNTSQIEQLRRRITMVHQNPFLFHSTVEKNVAYGLQVRKVPRSQWKSRIHECLSLMGIEHLRTQSAHKLSGGETQRVAVARALVIDPEVLILDEFTANVDRNYVQIMENVIMDIFRAKEISIFVITHDEHQATRLAHTRTHLVAGEVAEQERVRSEE